MEVSMCVDVSLSVLWPSQYQHSHQAVSKRRDHFNRLLSILLSILIKWSVHVCLDVRLCVLYTVTDQWPVSKRRAHFNQLLSIYSFIDIDKKWSPWVSGWVSFHWLSLHYIHFVAKKCINWFFNHDRVGCSALKRAVIHFYGFSCSDFRLPSSWLEIVKTFWILMYVYIYYIIKILIVCYDLIKD